MARTRLAVALVAPEPHRTEIDGLRRAIGGGISRIAPHITLVPPVNIRSDALPEALEALRAAAATTRTAIALWIGPAATFAPINRVLYLAVEPAQDADLQALHAIRDHFRHGILHRDEHRPFVPHVTLTNSLRPGDEESALRLFGRYRVEVSFERVDLLSFDNESQAWATIADATLGPRPIIGQGGLALELTAGTVLDPEARAFLSQLGLSRADFGRSQPQNVVISARREGEVVGVALAQVSSFISNLDLLVVAPGARRSGVGSHLLAALTSRLASAGSATMMAEATGQEDLCSFLQHRGWRPVSTSTLSTTLNV